MSVLLNIGNTHSEIAECSGGAIRLTAKLPTAELTAALLPPGEVFAASVVPEVAARLAERKIYFISSADCHNLIDFSQVDATTLGADRVANCVALAHYFPLPGIVVDFGTAITVEIVDADRIFRGGAIAPGRVLMRRALHGGTAQLPEIPLSSNFPALPGANTAEAIALGVDGGAIGMVRELLTRLKQKFSPRSLVAVGGDADFFLPEFPELTPGQEFFTLQGIRLAGKGE